MATPKKNKSSRKGSNKTFAAKRTMNPPQKARTGSRSHASSFQQHDIKGRQGSFETEGQHARTGSRGHE